MASLAVLDPSPLFRAGLAALARAMGLAPVEEAADLNELIERPDETARPELMLIGLPQSVKEIAPLMHEINGWAPTVKVVFIAPELDVAALIACFAAGACGYLVDSISREGLQHSLTLVSAGEKVFPSELASALSASELISGGAGRARRALRALQATDREIAVLSRLANGESNHAIAAALGISEAAVSTDIRHLLKRLGVSNRTQAALWAVAKGLAPPLAEVEPRRRPDPDGGGLTNAGPP